MGTRWVGSAAVAALLLGQTLVSGAQEPPPAPPPAVETAPPPPAVEIDEAVVLNFEGADIREVIHSLATALGLNYTIDPRVQGQVTIRTTGKIARRERHAFLKDDSSPLPLE